MKLNSLDTRKLLPSMSVIDGEEHISERLAWICSAFDSFVKSSDARRLALSAPYSMDTIQALTDEELQQYYKEFGLATYYPDLPRSSRNQMLYDEIRLYRKLGTKAAIESMCQYIFGENPISLEIIDNLAFDENGVLQDDSLIDMYDAVINIENASLNAFEVSRIFSNLTKFNRDSQKLRYIKFRYNSDVDCPVVPVENDIACVYYDSNVMCEPVNRKILYHLIDLDTGEDTPMETAPDIETIERGGSMLAGFRTVADPPEVPDIETIERGGSMLAGFRTVADPPEVENLGLYNIIDLQTEIIGVVKLRTKPDAVSMLDFETVESDKLTATSSFSGEVYVYISCETGYKFKEVSLNGVTVLATEIGVSEPRELRVTLIQSSTNTRLVIVFGYSSTYRYEIKVEKELEIA